MKNFKRAFQLFLAVLSALALSACNRETTPQPSVPHRFYDLILFKETGPTFAGIGSGLTFDSFFPNPESREGYLFEDYDSSGVVTSTTEYFFSSMLDPWHLSFTFSDGSLHRISCYADLMKSPHELNCDSVFSVQQAIQQQLKTHYGADFLKDAPSIDCDSLKDGVTGMQSATWNLPDDSGVSITLRAENLDAASFQNGTDDEFVVFCEIEMEFG